MKQLSIFLFALLLTAGVVSAQSTATVDQSGDGNEASVTQSLASTALVTQMGTTGGSGNDVVLTQSASQAAISQDGNGNRSEVAQETGSQVTITQVSIPSSSAFAGSDAEVDQKNGAIGTIHQTSNTGPGRIARLTQDGASTGLIDQVGLGKGHTGRIDQYGDANYSEIRQSGVGSNAWLQTLGDGNTAYADQEGTSHVLVGKQYGNGNDLTINQDGPFSGQITNIVTTGDDNTAVINQSVGSMDGGADTWNEARIVVTGSDNTIGLGQVGEDNITLLDQIGNGNTFTGLQAGAFNTADVNQAGDGNTATVTQN